MKIIAIEEHWNSASIRDALDDRADSLSGIAKHLDRRVSDYITTNIHITSSGMLHERLLRHALDFTSADQVLFSKRRAPRSPPATRKSYFT